MAARRDLRTARRRPPTRWFVRCIDRTRHVSNQDRRSMGRCPFQTAVDFGIARSMRATITHVGYTIRNPKRKRVTERHDQKGANSGRGQYITGFALLSSEKIGQVDLQPLCWRSIPRRCPRAESQGLGMRRNPSIAMRLAATRRHVVAMGVSPMVSRRRIAFESRRDDTRRRVGHLFRPGQ